MNYKETLNLPKTDFPMKANLIAREPEILAKWQNAGLYRQIQEVRKDAPLFVLHDGPPFANGDVHMGTALNKILKDLIVKSRSMLGFRAPFVPGWDCHGLPIEFKVVKESRGLSPLEVRQRSEQYARKYIEIQRNQFRRLGVFGDWENPYLTLDPAYETVILQVFADIVEKGLVYQSKKPVYWSTGAQTALAEAEVEYRDRHDPSIYVAFPIVSGGLAGRCSIAIWTTTPWTLPANLAVAVHPSFTYVAQKFSHPNEEPSRTLLLAKERIAAFTDEHAKLVRPAKQQRQRQVINHDQPAHKFLKRVIVLPKKREEGRQHGEEVQGQQPDENDVAGMQPQIYPMVSGRMAAVAEHSVVEQKGEGDERAVDTGIRGRIPILLPEYQGKVVMVDFPDARIFENNGSAVSQKRAVK